VCEKNNEKVVCLFKIRFSLESLVVVLELWRVWRVEQLELWNYRYLLQDRIETMSPKFQLAMKTFAASIRGFPLVKPLANYAKAERGRRLQKFGA
jgi:hypothetical protein